MSRVPITKHGRDHRPEGSDPIPFPSATLPYAIAGGETRTDVDDSTDTAVLLTTGAVSDNGADFFDVTNVATTGVISVLQQGLYLCIGNITWNDPFTALTILKWHVPLSNQFYDVGGAIVGAAIAASALDSRTFSDASDGQYQQAITLVNRPGTAPWDFYMTAYQESGSTQQTLDAGAGIVRVGNSVTFS